MCQNQVGGAINESIKEKEEGYDNLILPDIKKGSQYDGESKISSKNEGMVKVADDKTDVLPNLDNN